MQASEGRRERSSEEKARFLSDPFIIRVPFFPLPLHNKARYSVLIREPLNNKG